VRQTMLLSRLELGLRSAGRPIADADWMTAREALEIATLGGAGVLGRSDIGSLEPGKCADFFSLDLNTLGYAGALHDPVAAVVFCAPQSAHHTVINGRSVVKDGVIVTMDMGSVIATHNRCAARLLEG
jgi:8-oxoguanine deaminase